MSVDRNISEFVNPFPFPLPTLRAPLPTIRVFSTVSCWKPFLCTHFHSFSSIRGSPESTKIFVNGVKLGRGDVSEPMSNCPSTNWPGIAFRFSSLNLKPRKPEIWKRGRKSIFGDVLKVWRKILWKRGSKFYCVHINFADWQQLNLSQGRFVKLTSLQPTAATSINKPGSVKEIFCSNHHIGAKW